MFFYAIVIFLLLFLFICFLCDFITRVSIDFRSFTPLENKRENQQDFLRERERKKERIVKRIGYIEAVTS